jgi:integrase
MLDRLADPERKTGRPHSRASLVKIRSVLGQVLDTAERRQLVARNVARIAELTPSAKRTQPRTALTAEEARRLHEQLEYERLGPMFLLSMTTAIRPGEAAGVLWDDLDLDEDPVLHVRHAVRVEDKKAVLTDELKTAESYRSIELPAITVAALRQHKAAQATEALAAAVWNNDGGLAFTSRSGTPLSPPNVRRELREICERANVPALTPNELRHTGASLMSDAGVPLERIADTMGHTSTRMLEATYRHRIRPSIDAAASVMDGLFDETAD